MKNVEHYGKFIPASSLLPPGPKPRVLIQGEEMDECSVRDTANMSARPVPEDSLTPAHHEYSQDEVLYLDGTPERKLALSCRDERRQYEPETCPKERPERACARLFV